MFLLGIVGGVASGKSFLGKALERYGAVVLQGDQAGHDVLREPEVIRQLQQRWGDGVVNSAGEIIRAEVAARVFGDSDQARTERRFLERVTHPRIRARLIEQAHREEERGTPLLVIDAALLFESGWDTLCDAVLFVDTPRELRLERAKSRGWTQEQFDSRERSQLALTVKQQRSTWSFENGSSSGDTLERLDRFYQSILLPALHSKEAKPT